MKPDTTMMCHQRAAGVYAVAFLAAATLIGCATSNSRLTGTPPRPPTIPTQPPLAPGTATPTFLPDLTGPAGSQEGTPAASSEVLRILQAGDANYEAGNYVNAVNDYSLAILADPSNAEAYFKRGLSYLAIGNAVSALADFNTSIALDAARPEAYVGRARVSLLSGDHDSALVDLRRAEQVNPAYGPLYLVRGQIYAALDAPGGDVDRALAEFDRAVVLMPG